MSSLFSFLLFACIASICATKLNLQFNSKLPGIFTREFGSNTVLLTPESSPLVIDCDLPLKGYCSAGFKNLGSQTSSFQFKSIELTCTGNSVYYRDLTGSSKYSFQNNGALSCEYEAAFYESKIRSCKYSGFVYGFGISNSNVVLAELCYNLGTSSLSFVHYVAVARPALLESQKTFNPSNVTENLSIMKPVTFDDKTVQTENAALKDSITKNLPLYSNIVYYQLNELVPLNKLSPPFNHFADNFKSAEMIPFWQSLKYGNWKDVTNAISNLEIVGSSIYDVYSGISGVVSCPINQNCGFTNQLKYKFNNIDRNVPLIVWNYVQERRSGNGVVIIGVNSPFFDETSTNSTVLCKDMCDSVSWLQSLKSRKMVALGYVYCCRPEDVNYKLEGFPQ